MISLAATLKPSAAIFTLYAPTGTLGKLKAPAAVVCIVTVCPVASFFKVTEALGITAPEASVTVPLARPPVACANALTAVSTRIKRLCKTNLDFIKLTGYEARSAAKTRLRSCDGCSRVEDFRCNLAGCWMRCEANAQRGLTTRKVLDQSRPSDSSDKVMII